MNETPYYTYHITVLPERGVDVSDWTQHQANFRIDSGSQQLSVMGLKIGWKPGTNEMVSYDYLSINYLSIDGIQPGNSGSVEITASLNEPILNITVDHRYSGYYWGAVTLYAELIDDNGDNQYVVQDINLYQD